MFKIPHFLATSLALVIGLGSPLAWSEAVEKTRRNYNRATISNSGQINPGGSRFDAFSFWGTRWGSDREVETYRRPKAYSPAPKKPKIYAYRPDQLVTLADRKAKQPQPDRPVFATDAPEDYDPTPAELRSGKLDDSLAQTIFETFEAGETGIRVTGEQRSALAEFYRNRKYRAVWTSMDGIEPGARVILDKLRQAYEDGLNPADYRLPILDRQTIADIEYDLAAIAGFDIQLTALALRYGMHASGGRIDANRLSAYHDLKPPKAAAKTILGRLASAEDPADYLASLHPRHPAYGELKAALATLEDTVETVERNIPIPTGGTIVPGQVDPRIPAIRDRLIKDGHLEEPAVEVVPSGDNELPTMTVAALEGDIGDDSANGAAVYGPELVEAIKKFQRASGLKPDGLIGRRTVGAFNGKVEKSFNKRARIIANMERLRWLPRHLGRDHVFVNQAAYQLRLVKNDRVVWRTKVIVGKRSNQTSFFSDEMETVVFNPYWGVPQSIITEEMVPKLVNDPSYLDRLGYEVFTSSGRRISSSNVDWWGYSSSNPMAVRQPPGRKNALGEMKFMFPNKHAIYLHDTPTKRLFDSDNRAFSHGCVRVQNPRLLAEKVLGWNQDEIASYIDSGRNQKIALNRKLPVHLTYFTAWPDTSGEVSYFDDIYGRDERLELAFAATSATYR